MRPSLSLIAPLSRAALLALGALWIPACGAPGITVTTISDTGWSISWCRVSNRIAYNKPGPDPFYYKLYSMDPDGTEDRPFFPVPPAGLPGKHLGSPDWHPSGRFLAFVAEKDDHADAPPIPSLATPGWGGYSDLWVASAVGPGLWRLTDLPSDPDHALIIPRFSRDGTRLVWTEKWLASNLWIPDQQFGYWVMKVAEFREGPDGPSLVNVRTYAPGGNAFYEAYGLSPDGSKLIFCSSLASGNPWANQIFTVDLSTGAVVQLTVDGYNEHAYYTPDGSRLVWMTNVQSTAGGTDWWMMNADGSAKVRLTRFNEPGDPTYSGLPVWCGDTAWSLSGRFFLGSVETNLATSAGKIVRVAFDISP